MVTVGITIFPPSTGFSFWSNGAHQNVLNIWLLLRSIPDVDCILINGGDGEAPTPDERPPQFRDAIFARMPDVIDSLDVLIEAGAQVSAEDVARVHARGGKAISLKFGNSFVIDGERAIHNLPSGAIFNGAKFDEVWTTDQHTHTCSSYWETLYRCPVRSLPHVWTPFFVDWQTSQFPPGLKSGYQPGRTKKRVAIMEPNIQFVKTCHIPMLIAENAWRARPDLIETVLVGSSIQMRGRLAFETFVGALDVAKAIGADGLPVMTFEPRYRAPWYLSQWADVVVSHQWIQVPNYLHYDCLHMGYPLVHNVPGMPGYEYEGFDAHGGALALVRAMTEHDARSDDYRHTTRGFLRGVLATNPVNIEAHVRALAEVMR